jgi:hypothetical protein
MPSKLTRHVYDNPNTTFDQFVSVCARLFVTPDRDLTNLDFPEAGERDTSHAEAAEKFKEERKLLKQMGEEELRVESTKALIRKFGELSKVMRGGLKRRSRYLNMLEQVRGWEPPTDKHTKFKDFMITQLELSIQEDCNNNFEYFLKDLWYDHSSYYKQKVNWLDQQIDYHNQSQKAVDKIYDENVEWTNQLRESLVSRKQGVEVEAAGVEAAGEPEPALV